MIIVSSTRGLCVLFLRDSVMKITFLLVLMTNYLLSLLVDLCTGRGLQYHYSHNPVYAHRLTLHCCIESINEPRLSCSVQQFDKVTRGECAILTQECRAVSRTKAVDPPRGSSHHAESRHSRTVPSAAAETAQRLDVQSGTSCGKTEGDSSITPGNRVTVRIRAQRQIK